MFCFNWISWISFIIFSASWEFLYETCQGPWKLVGQQTNQRSTQKVFVSWPSSKLLLSDYWAWTFKSLASSHGCHAPKAYFSVPWFHQAEGCLWGTHACDQVCSWLPPLSLTCSLHFSTYPLQDFFSWIILVTAISTLAAALGEPDLIHSPPVLLPLMCSFLLHCCS